MQGLIISNISNTYIVETIEGTYEAVARGKFKIGELSPVVGDKVMIEIIENNKAVINDILPRDNYIKRPKVANITQIVLVISSKDPKPDLLMLDKQLAFCEYLKVKPIIVMNKMDLEKTEKIENIKQIYENIGYKMIITNAKLGIGIDEIKENLENNISAFSGNSGVGKSTLLNKIIGDDVTQEGLISKKNKKGKNTTTSIKLYKINANTYIADTPGFSTFDIYEIEKENLYKYFKEMNEYEKKCSFVGCTHIKEKECGIKEALEQGKISESRYENYKKIYEDLKDKEEHKW